MDPPVNATHMKVLLVGDNYVGKTCICIRLTSNDFPGEHVPTVFDNFLAIILVDKISAYATLWDTVAGEDYDRARQQGYSDTDVFLLCFSCNNPRSFESIRTKWLPEIRNHMPTTPFILVATKTDLKTDESALDLLSTVHNRGPISYEEGQALAEEIGAAAYMETSSLQGEGVHEVLAAAARITRTQRASAPGNGGKQLSKCSIQ